MIVIPFKTETRTATIDVKSAANCTVTPKKRRIFWRMLRGDFNKGVPIEQARETGKEAKRVFVEKGLDIPILVNIWFHKCKKEIQGMGWSEENFLAWCEGAEISPHDEDHPTSPPANATKQEIADFKKAEASALHIAREGRKIIVY